MGAINFFRKLYGISLNVSSLSKFACVFPFHTSASHFKQNPQWGSTKTNRNIKLKKLYLAQMDPETEQVLAPLRAQVKEQVSSLKYYTMRTQEFFTDSRATLFVPSKHLGLQISKLKKQLPN